MRHGRHLGLADQFRQEEREDRSGAHRVRLSAGGEQDQGRLHEAPEEHQEDDLHRQVLPEVTESSVVLAV